MVRSYVKQESTELSNKGLDGQYFRDEIYKVITTLNAKLPSSSYKTDKDHDNSATFTAGQHKAFVVKEDDFIDAIAGAIIDVALTISVGVVRINNLYFKEEITLESTAAVIFSNCRFNKPVRVESGGQAQFVGCSFRDTGFIDNSGLAASVYVNGGARTSTNHVNVTVISEIIA
jgi:hypothetical protein